MNYLQIDPVEGQWYISEGFKASAGAPPGPQEIEEMTKHNLGAHKMILAGPFASREIAEQQLSEYSDFHQPFVWKSGE